MDRIVTLLSILLGIAGLCMMAGYYWHAAFFLALFVALVASCGWLMWSTWRHEGD